MAKSSILPHELLSHIFAYTLQALSPESESNQAHNPNVLREVEARERRRRALLRTLLLVSRTFAGVVRGTPVLWATIVITGSRSNSDYTAPSTSTGAQAGGGSESASESASQDRCQWNFVETCLRMSGNHPLSITIQYLDTVKATLPDAWGLGSESPAPCEDHIVRALKLLKPHSHRWEILNVFCAGHKCLSVLPPLGLLAPDGHTVNAPVLRALSLHFFPPRLVDGVVTTLVHLRYLAGMLRVSRLVSLKLDYIGSPWTGRLVDAEEARVETSRMGNEFGAWSRTLTVLSLATFDSSAIYTWLAFAAVFPQLVLLKLHHLRLRELSRDISARLLQLESSDTGPDDTNLPEVLLPSIRHLYLTHIGLVLPVFAYLRAPNLHSLTLGGMPGEHNLGSDINDLRDVFTTDRFSAKFPELTTLCLTSPWGANFSSTAPPGPRLARSWALDVSYLAFLALLPPCITHFVLLVRSGRDEPAIDALGSKSDSGWLVPGLETLTVMRASANVQENDATGLLPGIHFALPNILRARLKESKSKRKKGGAVPALQTLHLVDMVLSKSELEMLRATVDDIKEVPPPLVAELLDMEGSAFLREIPTLRVF